MISVSDEPDQIITNRDNADIIIYYTGLSDNAHTGISMNLLCEISQDDTKILCLVREMTDLSDAMSVNGSHRVSKTYPRPVNFDEFIDDMNYYANLEQNFHYRKSIYVVDDDESYLPIITRWLSEDYNVSAFNSGTDALNGLSAVIPDLILLDYEMPGINGFELMCIIRSRYNDPQIPIIFLTGKNDRGHVFRVLEDRPDGYILKTSQRETIMDTIRRFFAETVFRASFTPC
ncbi:MAG: response regulator [Lachnospiraceae bacterium]|nr:response regulator [Lachnospiraceae bacterium]